jgi:hypothetical protein
MPSTGMLRRVALVRTDVSAESIASIIRVTRISELATTLAVRSVLRLLLIANVVSSSPFCLLIALISFMKNVFLVDDFFGWKCFNGFSPNETIPFKSDYQFLKVNCSFCLIKHLATKTNTGLHIRQVKLFYDSLARYTRTYIS